MVAPVHVGDDEARMKTSSPASQPRKTLEDCIGSMPDRKICRCRKEWLHHLPYDTIWSCMECESLRPRDRNDVRYNDANVLRATALHLQPLSPSSTSKPVTWTPT